MLALERREGDQAAGLRRLLSDCETRMLALSGTDPDRVAALALQLALACERDGLRILLVDLTRGALARHLGCTVRYELMHVIDSHRRLEQVLIAAPQDIPVLPAARGMRALADAWGGRARFSEFIELAGGAPQLVVAVTPPAQLGALARVSDNDTLLVVDATNGEDLKACYAALKRAHTARAAPPRLVYADGPDPHAALSAHARLSGTARSFLGREPEVVGRLCSRPEQVALDGIPALDVAGLASAIRRWPRPRAAAAAGPSSSVYSPIHSSL